MLYRLFVWSVLLSAVFPSFGADIVINEIMYHPSSERVQEEYIELYNKGTNVVSLQGWQLSKGVSFQITNDVKLGAGQFLVLAADLAAFEAKYPGVTNVIGGWSGTLRNSGEEVQLEDALGANQDSVTYSSEGDWATRQRGPSVNGHMGWEWFAEHDGLGKSLELVNTRVSNNSGQNWKSSIALQGTPGAANSVAAANSAPLILEVQHSPAVPKSSEAITVTAQIEDEPGSTIIAMLFYRVASGATLPAFSTNAMFDDGAHNDGVAGDRIYGVALLPQLSGTVIEFYVQARDGAGNTRTWPAAARQENGTFAQTANALLEVDDNPYSGSQPLVRLVLTEPERAELASGDIRQTDAQMNATFIHRDGTGVDIRYNAGVRIRGAGSRNAQVPNFRLNLPADRRWNGVDAVNLNAQFGYLQVLGSALAQRAGLAAADGRSVQVRVNGVNLVNSTARYYGTYAMMEVIGGDYAAKHFVNDPDGNVYRGSSPQHSAGLAYLGTNSANYVSAGYAKASNGSENDWSDLIRLTEVLSTVTNETYVEQVRQVANVELWMRYFAAFTLLQSMETSMGTGRGDDYGMYRGINDPRFILLPHDLDTIFGMGDTPVGPTANIFRMVPLVGQPMPPHQQPNVQFLNRFMLHPEFVPIYYRELVRLMNSTFSTAQVNPLIDKLLGDYVPAATLDGLKAFSAARNANVLAQIPLALTVNTTATVTNGYPTTTSGFVTLTGRANAVDTRSVRVNGSAASWSAWQASWGITNLALAPGINRVLVQALDGAGAELERTTIDVYYNDGTVVNAGGTLSSDTVWQAAAGPYVITSTLTIPAGQTLTIQPGTTVFLNAGTAINVANGGRLIAEGTDAARIVFARMPGAAAWNGITVNGAAGSPETRIAYAHIEGNSAVAIDVLDGTVFLDHLTFGTTTSQYVVVDRASFIISHCVFPRPTAQFEMVHGVGGIRADGRGIITHCFFGAPNGYNDTIDFTGGNRPGPILQVINNVFTGSSDDILDLDSTDAWVEGNIFMHAHRNGSPDSSSAVSGGADNADTSQVTIIGNIFYDCDQVANAKQGNFYTLINNTIVRQTRVGGVDTDAAVIIMADDGTVEGAGMYLEGNIIHSAEKLVRNQTASLVTFTNNLMPLPWSGPGGGNSSEDPRLKYIPQLSETTNFVSWQQAQILRAWFSLLPGSPGRGTGPNGRDKGGVIPLGASLSGEPDSVTSDSSATLRVGINVTGNGVPTAGFPNGSGFTHYQWRLDSGAWSAELPTATPINLSGLSNGPHVVQVAGKRDSGFYQDDPAFGTEAVITSSKTWTVDSAYSGTLVLNEILARNSSAVPIGDEYPDLIELYNGATGEIDLSGMGITDDANDPFKFKFPIGTSIGPKQYLVLPGTSDAVPGLKTGFALNQRGSGLYLYSKTGVLLDSVVFGPQVQDLSIGRFANGSWSLTRPTFGTRNILQPLGETSALKINEWLAAGSETFPDDFVELYNSDALPVRLDGLFLTDELAGAPQRYALPPLTFIGSFGHLAFFAAGNDPDSLSFNLSSEVGLIALTSGTSIIDYINYGPQTAGVSEGRKPSGSATFSSFAQPTPNAPNPGLGGDINVTNIVVPLLTFTDAWRYEATGTDLQTAWHDPSYNDSQWPSGPGLLYIESNAAVPFRNTLLSFTSPPQITFYFRTKFTVTTNLSNFALRALTYIDDGAVIYLNGTEVQRVRMPAGAINYSTLALSSPPDGDAVLESFTFPSSALQMGENVLAVEVHQQLQTSSDMVWGMALEASRFETNLVASFALLNEVMANNRTYAGSDGTTTDWVELYNPLSTTIDLSNQSLTDDINDPRRWAFPAGTTVPGHGRLVVRFDPDAPPGALNTGFGLGANGDEVYLFDTPARGGALLDSITFGLQPPDYAIGRVPDGAPNWQLTIPTPDSQNIVVTLGPPANLVINEWMANPNSGDDWFEIYNPNNQPVALGGLFLTDDLNDRSKSRIPDLSFVSLNTNGFVQFFADNNPQNGPDHVSFRLSNGGEAIGLAFPNGQLIDAVTFGAQAPGVSEGFLPDGSTNLARFAETPSPAESNFLPLRNVAINEVLSHSDLPLEDTIELLNLTSEVVDISGWYLSDTADALQKFRIPENTVLAPFGFAVFYESEFNPNPGFFPSFALSSSRGDQVYLSEARPNGELTGYRTIVKFGPAESGVSFGRVETSEGFDFAAQFQRTFAQPNSAPKVGPIVISEVMYHPPDVNGTNDNVLDEFIELQNTSGAPVTLQDPTIAPNTWRLRDAVDFNFPSGVTLPSGGFLLVVSFDPVLEPAALAAFRSKYAVNPAVPVLGPYRGKLDNSKDSVELYKPDPPEGSVPYVLVDKVRYRDSAPWPTAADSGTNVISLQRRTAAAYGNDPINWIAGAPTAGTPTGAAAGAAPVINAQPASQTVLPDATVSFSMNVSGAEPLAFQWRFNGVDIPGATASSLTLANVQLANSGAYRVRISNPFGATISDPANLVLQVKPEITLEPQDKIVAPGSTAIFTVSARGTQPLQYQWRFNGNSISGANSFQLVLSNIVAGGYSAIVSNAFGTATSRVATLVINDPPSITTQPEGRTLLAGDTLLLSVSATGTAPLAYQWRLNGAPLAGANGASLQLTNVQPGQSGRYTVRITNAVGTVISQPADVLIVPPPALEFFSSDTTAAEAGLDPATVFIRRIGSTNFAFQVNLAISGSATPGSDYQSIPVPISFPAGIAQVLVSIIPINDATREPKETVVLQLRPGTGYTVGVASTITAFITDDDNASPTVSIATPGSGTVYPITPTNITFTTTAGDSDGAVQKVEYFNHGTNLLGSATSAPYTVTWTNAAPGTNVITAVATDDLGATGISTAITLRVNHAPSVVIANPLDGETFTPGTNLLIQAATTDIDGNIAQIKIYQGTTLLASLSAPPFQVSWPAAQEGVYTFFAVATDNLGMSTASALSTITIRQPRIGFSDMFDDRGDITGFSVTATGNSTAASREANEPRAYNASTRTLWLRWVAPASGFAVIDTFESGFDTVLAVFTNNPPHIQNLSNLGLVAESDDVNGAQSQVVFEAAEDTIYQIRVEGFGPTDFGNVTLHAYLVTRGPHIIAHPQSLTVLTNATTNLTSTAAATVAFTNQWRFNGTNIQGATNFTLVISNISSAKEGEYTMLVGNAFGTDISRPAKLEIGSRPAVVVDPQSITAVEGQTITFSAGATGTLPIAYRWRKNNAYIYEYITNSYTGFYTLANLTTNNAGNYALALTNIFGISARLSQTAVLTVLPDGDHDGIPNAWETQYGLNPTNYADGALDADADGMSNWQEYVAGTNPTNALSYLKVNQFAHAAGSATVTFEAVSNKTYSVLFNPTLNPAGWARLQNVDPRTTNRTVTVIDAAAGPPNRFYRLVTPQLP